MTPEEVEQLARSVRVQRVSPLLIFPFPSIFSSLFVLRMSNVFVYKLMIGCCCCCCCYPNESWIDGWLAGDPCSASATHCHRCRCWVNGNTCCLGRGNTRHGMERKNKRSNLGGLQVDTVEIKMYILKFLLLPPPPSQTVMLRKFDECEFVKKESVFKQRRPKQWAMFHALRLAFSSSLIINDDSTLLMIMRFRFMGRIDITNSLTHLLFLSFFLSLSQCF